jgi:hypothetical protein
MATATCVFLNQIIAHAQGTAFSYQGHLNAGGNPANGSYDLRFAIYDSLANGSVMGNPELCKYSDAIQECAFRCFLSPSDVASGNFD